MLNQLRRDLAAGLGVITMVAVFFEVQGIQGWLLTLGAITTTLAVGMATSFAIYTEEV